MRSILPNTIAVLGFLSAACSTIRGQSPAVTGRSNGTSRGLSQVGPANSPGEALTRLDQQGAVSIEVTPLNLGVGTDNLEFEVSMNTHSVDLSMDLVTAATLDTDTGIHVAATGWDGPRAADTMSLAP